MSKYENILDFTGQESGVIVYGGLSTERMGVRVDDMEHLVNSKNPLMRAVFSRIEDLEQFSGCRADELHFKAFNEDCTLTYTDDCKESLQGLDVFDCLGVVVDYERSQFGEVFTDLSDPFKVANMLAYIWGEWLLNQSELFFEWRDDDEQELTERQIAVIVQEIREFVGSRSEVELMEELTNEYC